jgi:thiamine-monophosphate kinase
MTPTGGAIAADEQTMAALGEFGLIAALSGWLRGISPADPRTLVGIGDDAAVLAAPDGRVVASTDFLLEGRHFRREWSSAADVGHKAAARSLIDVAAMGAVPTGLLVALAAPPDLPVTWARELTEGLAAECARVGATVIGGDTASAGSVLLATTVLGDLAGRAPVLRSGAAPGDLVAVTGPLGHAAAGLALLEAVHTVSPPAPPAWAGSLVAAHRRPQPPYDAGPQAADLGATAMIDISDGLLADLGHIASASGVLIDLSSDRLSPGAGLQAAARALHAQAQAWVLTGGEDHALAATFSPGTALPPRWTTIGQVREGQGVVVDGQPWAGSAGWDHFRG